MPVADDPLAYTDRMVTLLGLYFQIRDDYQNLVSADVSERSIEFLPFVYCNCTCSAARHACVLSPHPRNRPTSITQNSHQGHIKALAKSSSDIAVH
jgi:hypothetical protein